MALSVMLMALSVMLMALSGAHCARRVTRRPLALYHVAWLALAARRVCLLGPHVSPRGCLHAPITLPCMRHSTFYLSTSCPRMPDCRNPTPTWTGTATCESTAQREGVGKSESSPIKSKQVQSSPSKSKQVQSSPSESSQIKSRQVK